MESSKFWTFWKSVALIMIFANIILSSYILFKFNMLGSLRDAAHNVDNAIVFSLSLLQTIIALGAFAGFWLVRGSARDAARDAAEKSLAQYIRSDEFAPILQRALVEPEVQSRLARGVATRIAQVSGENQNIENSEGLDELVFAAGEEEGDDNG